MRTIIGLGANLGDPIRQLQAAVERLAQVVDVETVSGVYRTEPVGIVDQPDFYNLVLRGGTGATVYGLLEHAHGIETELGRTRTVRDAPRTIDVDLLTYGELVLTSRELTIPHPRLHVRTFVLIPLAEIAPEWHHPGLGTTAAESLGRIDHPSFVTRWGELPIHRRG